ncbi:MAG: hypothetical protein KBD78_01250 [Oligoflexales bacterium]|nr:hypothetical protein [Oligoflexales bacterium]
MFDQIDIELLKDFRIFLDQNVIQGGYRLLWIFFWPILYYWPIKELQKDDILTAILYVAFLTFSGLCLIIFPLEYLKEENSFAFYSFICVVFGALGYMRWQKISVLAHSPLKGQKKLIEENKNGKE